MDWSKTKTIFIIVFSILNVFLYSVYINNYNEEQELEVLGESNIESDLKNANISVGNLPVSTEKVTYVSGKINTFDNFDFDQVTKNQIITVSDNMIIEGTMKKPEKLEALNEKTLTEFLKRTVFKGEEYRLWQINKSAREATFFQVMNDKTIFYNQSATIKVYWSEKEEITKYEQTMFGSLKAIGEKSMLIKPIQAIKTIFEKGYLKDHTTISFVNLGYSTLVPLTETQVLSPTWHIRAMVPDENGRKKQQDFFVNAVDNQILDIEKNIQFKNKAATDVEYKERVRSNVDAKQSELSK
ncbi:two-component system regulatory protein YycI [Kurthia gibsonii]|uniref:two-component system regulatory protein YycI n=1 Tax=Kurthia gibsonii TaxID=33946 RepID=UPI002DBC7F8A|nr:two-component system regulatory protein YycI [Kurthia gibsonii]MEB7773177.1 two-component system regulatory protein YycI [Kurthia gibsonii]